METDTNEQRNFEVLLKQFEMTVAERKLELQFFWQRSLFFWGFIAAAFIAYAASDKDKFAQLLISCFGFICAITWTLANRGSKYWYEQWESKSCLDRFKDIEGGLYKMERPPIHPHLFHSGRRYSVTRLATILSDYTILVWVALAVSAARRIDWLPMNHGAFAVAGVTVVYAVLLLWRGRFSGKA